MGLISWALLTDVYTQLFTRPPVPTHDFTGKTVLLTGANSGLGKEALYHLIRLGASQVIAAVRSVESGTAVKEEVERTTRRNGVIELLELDLGNYDSVKAFADNVAQRVDRLDHAVMNASIATEDYATLEGNESTVTVNVVSTVYLVLLLLPIMRASHRK